MKEIKIDELQKLISNIDYTVKDSFPIKVLIKNGNNKAKVEFGIAKPFECCGEIFEEQQYAMILSTTKYKITNLVFDVKDCDFISYEEIGENIEHVKRFINEDENNETEFFLYDKNSFNGKYKVLSEIPFEFIAEVEEGITQSDMTSETKKGVDWFKEMLDEDTIIFEEDNGEIANLNDMKGSDFAFFFEKRYKLYYDMSTHHLTKYYPRDRKDFLKIIESNEQFRWILLKICTNEDLLHALKPCNVIVKNNLTGDKKIVENINDFLEKVLNMCYQKLTNQNYITE